MAETPRPCPGPQIRIAGDSTTPGSFSVCTECPRAGCPLRGSFVSPIPVPGGYTEAARTAQAVQANQPPCPGPTLKPNQ